MALFRTRAPEQRTNTWWAAFKDTVTPVHAGVTVSETTANSGGAAGPATTTAIYFSANTLLDAGDLLVGSRNVPALPAGGTSAGTTTVTIPPDAAPGTWQLLVVADAAGVAAETNESNNVRAAYVRVGPDLRVSSGTAPSKVTAGTAFPVTDTTANVGGASATTGRTGAAGS